LEPIVFIGWPTAFGDLRLLLGPTASGYLRPGYPRLAFTGIWTLDEVGSGS
jgi:hypothetical protein